jgi:hypothetical protein
MVIIALVYLIASQCSAVTIHVPDDYATIQPAIDAASYGDTVMLACDTHWTSSYIEMKSGITLMSETGSPDCATIFFVTSGCVVFEEVDNQTYLIGVTVSGGQGKPVQEGMFWISMGGGIHILKGSPKVIDCVISANGAERGGGACCRLNSYPTFEGCTFVDNYCLDGGAMYCAGIGDMFPAIPVLERCIIAYNEADGTIGDIYCEDTISVPTISCTDIYGNENGDWSVSIFDQSGVSGNISADPLFCDLPNGDYRIESASPCTPSNNTCAALIGALEVCTLYVLCGDVNCDGTVDIDDVMYLIHYIFTGGPEPCPYESGDVTCDGFVDIDDVMYIIDYIFTGGYAPCDIDGDGEPDC